MAAVGDKPAEFENSGDELFPHLQGGIHPSAVVATFEISRAASGEFLAVPEVTREAE